MKLIQLTKPYFKTAFFMSNYRSIFNPMKASCIFDFKEAATAPGIKPARPIYSSLFCLLLLPSLCVSAFGDPVDKKYTITDLGVAGGTDTDSVAYGLNSAGAVTGLTGQYGDSFGFSGRAFLWLPTFPNGTTGAMTALSGLPGEVCSFDGNLIDQGSDAHGINSTNQVAGWSFTGSPSNCFTAAAHAAIFTTGGAKDLGVPATFSSSYGADINTAGQVVGYAEDGIPRLQAFVYDGSFHLLGSLPGFPFGQALKINQSGQIAGRASTVDLTGFHGFLHSGVAPLTAADDIGTLGGANASANSLNDAGVVVGSSTLASEITHAFLYSVGKMTDLGTLNNPAGTNSGGFGINSNGDVVGESDAADGSMHAVIWPQGKDIQDLNTLIDEASGWVLTSANAINNSGQIAGFGMVNGHRHGFLLSPPEGVVSVTLKSNTVCGTQQTTGTVTLANAAGDGGASVSIVSSKPHLADVAGTVKVPEGETTATFTVTTHDVASPTEVTLNAHYGGTIVPATITVQPLLAKVDTTPDQICSLNAAAATVTLACAATSPTTITLASSDSGVGSVPASVVVPAGQTTANFSVVGGDTLPSVDVTVSASFESEKQTAKVTVQPIIGNLALKPATVVGAKTSQGIVTLTDGKGCFPPAGGLDVKLFSDNPSLASPVHSSLTMPPNSNVGFFTIDTQLPTDANCPSGLAKDGSCSVNFAAFSAGSTQSAALTVTPPKAAGAAQDVTQLISVFAGGFFFDHTGGHYLQELQIVNQTSSTTSIKGPIALVLGYFHPGDSDPDPWTSAGGFDQSKHPLTAGVTAVVTPTGRPYVLLPLQGLPQPGVFNPGDSVFVTLSFNDPSNAFITYNPLFFANGSF